MCVCRCRTYRRAVRASGTKRRTSAPDTGADNPANQGRLELDQYLDGIAAQFEASRAAAVAAIHTRAQAEARQAKVRAQILSLIGALPERTPLNAKIVGETQAEGFRIRKVLFESQPNFFVTALLYVPDGAAPGAKRAAILMTPGHAAERQSRRCAHGRNLRPQRLHRALLRSHRPGRASAVSRSRQARRVIGQRGRPASMARLACSRCSSARPSPSTKFGTRCAAWIISLPFPMSIRIASAPSAAPAEAPSPPSPARSTPRIAAIGTACYITSFDTLLPALGPQDAEQSTPRFISSGLGFPDWIELAAPRPYAVISTYSDMFPFAGARATRHRGAPLLFPLRSGQRRNAGRRRGALGVPPTPTVPALNADTTNHVSPQARLAVDHRPRPPRRAHAHHGQHRQLLHAQSCSLSADADHPIRSCRRRSASCDGAARRCSKGCVPGDAYRPGRDQLSRLRHGLLAEQKTRGANRARAPAHDRI